MIYFWLSISVWLIKFSIAMMEKQKFLGEFSHLFPLYPLCSQVMCWSVPSLRFTWDPLCSSVGLSLCSSLQHVTLPWELQQPQLSGLLSPPSNSESLLSVPWWLFVLKPFSQKLVGKIIHFVISCQGSLFWVAWCPMF